MSKPKVIISNAYQKRLREIEDFIWESSENSLLAIDTFLTAHDQALEFLKENPTTPAIHPQTGDQSWPFSEGRYRLFNKFVNNKINLIDLIDNRMSNLKIYPNNVMPTYSED
jgi:hypothetical protein